MRIKEVEQATGLTAKAIRLYESKGLLSVARQAENDYRDYTDEDVMRLKTISVLRRLNIPLKEIKEWCDGETELRDLIARASYQAQMAQEEEKAKTELTTELLRILEENPLADLPTAIEDAAALRELYRKLDDWKEEVNGNILWPVWWSVIALGPVGWTFFRIISGETEKAIWSLMISLVVISFVCTRWCRYIQIEKKKRNTKGCLAALVFVVFGVLLAIGSVVFVEVCQRVIFSSGSGVYLFRNPWIFVAILFPIAELLFAMDIDFGEKKQRAPKEDEKPGVFGWLFIIGVNLTVLYCCITSVSFYSDGVFTRHSVFNPSGHVYTVSDVAQVEAGFRGGLITWLPWYQTGDFYYEVIFHDGTKEVWTDLNAVDDDGEDDPWLLILELDKELMEAGVEKVSNWEYREDFPYDTSCLEIADQILNNQ